MIKRYKKLLLALATISAFLCAPASTLVASAAPAPCGPAGSGKYNCTFWTTTPLEGPSNGTLAQGTNWVICQEPGRTVKVSGWENNWWAWTLRDSGTGSYGSGWGWVNAVYAKGGNNYEGFSGVPRCGSAHGLPPQTASAPAPQPAPKPSPAVNRAPARTSTTPATQSSGSSTVSSSTHAADTTAPDSDNRIVAFGACPPRHTCHYNTDAYYQTHVPEGPRFNCGMDRVFHVGTSKNWYAVCREDQRAAARLLQNDLR